MQPTKNISYIEVAVLDSEHPFDTLLLYGWKLQTPLPCSPLAEAQESSWFM